MRERKRGLAGTALKNSKRRKIAFKAVAFAQEMSRRVSALEKRVNGAETKIEGQQIAQEVREFKARMAKRYSALERQTTQATTGKIMDYYGITNPRIRKLIHQEAQKMSSSIYESPQYDALKKARGLVFLFDSGTTRHKEDGAVKAVIRLMHETQANIRRNEKEGSTLIKMD